MTARVLFMSTPEFGVPTLRSLAQDPRFEVVGVVTQPDRPAGRGLRLTPPPVKLAAATLGIPVLQPHSLRTARAQAAIKALAPDVCAVAAYGQWIPAEVFDLPPKRSLNLHPSLIPRHRGAAPAVGALLAGDDRVGLSVIFVEDEMDAGDLLAQMIIGVGPDDTAGDIMARLARLGAAFFVDVLAAWVAGELTPLPQDHTQATWIDRLDREAGRIDWQMPAAEIDRRCRAFSPWPGTFTFFAGRRLLIHRAALLPGVESSGRDVLPGTVVPEGADVAVVTGEGLLALREVQLAGRRRLLVRDFLHGQRDFIGARLG